MTIAVPGAQRSAAPLECYRRCTHSPESAVRSAPLAIR
jgi:hypothetical protein